jgi:hypothetical protein
MLTITLTPEEIDELRFILTSYLSDLRMEIADTDRRTFREQLKQPLTWNGPLP